MRKNVFVKAMLLLVALIGLSFYMEAGTPQDKKEKKEKKVKEKKEMEPFVLPDEMTGIEEFDEYLYKCDTLWTKIQTYRDSVRFFSVDTVLLFDSETNTNYYGLKITDQHGEERDWSQSLMQGLEMVGTGVSIIADGLIINLMTATATTSLISDPIKGFKYRKYLKYGPQIGLLAAGEIKEISNRTKTQMKDLRSIYNNKSEKSTDSTILIPIPEDADINLEDLVDLNEYDLGSDDGAIELPKELLELDLDA